MRKIIIYECEFCKAKYETEEEAKECEKRRHFPLEELRISNPVYFSKTSNFPDAILLNFANKVARYRRE